MSDRRWQIREGRYFREAWERTRSRVNRADTYLEHVRWRLSRDPRSGVKAVLRDLWTIELTWPTDVTDGIFVYYTFDDVTVTLESVKPCADFIDRWE